MSNTVLGIKGIGAFVIVFLAAVFVAIGVAFSGSVKSQTALTADDFFTSLISNTADIDHGEAVFVIRNPTASDISVKASDLTARMQNYKGSFVDRYELYILGNATISQNVTDYKDWIWNETKTDANGTYSVPHYDRNVTGWHWNNFTKEEYAPVSDFTFKTGQTITVKLKGYWKPMLGEVSNEWFPRLNAGGTVFEQGKWAWWNGTWQYKAGINITNNAGSVLSDYQMPLNITYNSHMASDFSDLRFLNGSENVSLSYWVEQKSNSNWAYVWVKVPSIPTGTSQNLIYMYYGSTGAISISDGRSVFLLWDNFTGTSLNTSLWNGITAGGGSVSVNNGVTLTSGTGCSWDRGEIATVGNYTFPFRFTAYWTNSNAGSGSNARTELAIGSEYPGPQTAGAYDWGGQNTGTSLTWYVRNDSVSDSNTKKYEALNFSNSIYKTTMYYFNNSYGVFNVSNSTMTYNIGAWTYSQYGSSTVVGISVDTCNTQLNSVFNMTYIAKYAYPEPIYSIGGEQTGGEQAARNATMQGIQDSLGQSAPLYYDQWVYSAADGSTQSLVRFDIVTSNASKRWGFNFYNSTEFNNGSGYNSSYNVTPSFYGLQMNYTEGLSAANIEYRVSKFINDTKGLTS